VCIAFGEKTNEISKFFEGFTNFNYVTEIKQYGNFTKNSIVYQIKYSKNDYNAY